MIDTLLVALAVAGQSTMQCKTVNEQTNRNQFNTFVDRLLIERSARSAFEEFSRPDLEQHNPKFGKDRESTILQYTSMFNRPGSRFKIESVTFEGNLGILRFSGKLDPSMSGAQVTAFFRIDCGKIVEAWDIVSLTE